MKNDKIIMIDEEVIQWWTFVNVVMSLQVPSKQQIFWPPEHLTTFQERLCTLKLELEVVMDYFPVPSHFPRGTE